MIHNILQMLLRESSCFTPSSPLTPRPPGLITPTSPSPFGNHWPLLNSSASETFPNLSHLISQTNSVTLSPAPSIDSTSGGSPKQEAGAVPPLYLPPHLQIPQNLTSGIVMNIVNVFKKAAVCTTLFDLSKLFIHVMLLSR